MKGFLGYFVFRSFHREEGGFSLALSLKVLLRAFMVSLREFLEKAQRLGLTALGKKALSIEDFGSAEKIKGLPCLFELRLATFENLL